MRQIDIADSETSGDYFFSSVLHQNEGCGSIFPSLRCSMEFPNIKPSTRQGAVIALRSEAGGRVGPVIFEKLVAFQAASCILHRAEEIIRGLRSMQADADEVVDRMG